MARRSYDCQHCGALFPSTTEHLIHIHEAHEPRRVGDPRPAPLTRGWLCSRCAVEIPLREEFCACGRERPSYVAQTGVSVG
jgi:hypothetical protein